MATTVFWVDGVAITYKGPCAHCGATATDSNADRALRDWDKLLNPCAVCGKPIRIISGEIEHYAASEAAPFHHWGLRHYEKEAETYWGFHLPSGFVDIHAHIGCAIKATPFAKWPEAARNEMAATGTLAR